MVAVTVVWWCHGALLCVMPQGTAACRVAATALPHVSPQRAGAHYATIAFAACHATALLQTESKSKKEK